MFGLFKKREKHIVEFTDGNWDEEVLQYQGVVLVDIWASWCGPCKLIGPIVEEIADEFAGRAKIGKLNSEYNQKSKELGIRSIPTLLFFKNGKLVNKIVEAQPKNNVIEKIEKYL